jgi:type 1 glutamine amidotransferase
MAGWASLALVLVLTACAGGGGDGGAGTPRPADSGPARILLFTKTAAYHHRSIPAGVAALKRVAPAAGFVAEATEDAGAFTESNLSRYRAVVFLLTTGDVLDETQQKAFEGFMRAGGGYAGVHSAADTEYGWPWYGAMVGAVFKNHGKITQATIRVTDERHPSTAHLGIEWIRSDEWYNFRTNPRPNVHVLATADERTFAGGTMGADHPIAWCHSYEGGRSWYTAGGHPESAYEDARFIQHLVGGIRWTAGLQDADCSSG